MKTFISYLLEKEQKTYEFKIKFANQELDSEALDRIEHALAAYMLAALASQSIFHLRRAH